MAYGKSLELRYLQPGKRTFYAAYTETEHPDEKKREEAGMLNYHGPYVNPEKDRTLAGRKRIRARKAARRV